MRPYIVSTATDDQTKVMTVTIAAANQVEAEAFARNYFGDYRADFRNHNVVTAAGTSEFGLDTFYVFTVTALGAR